MNLFEKYLSKYREHITKSHVGLPSNINDWPEEWQEAYEERAAIIEYDGGKSRHEAEKKSEKLQREAYKNQLNTF